MYYWRHIGREQEGVMYEMSIIHCYICVGRLVEIAWQRYQEGIGLKMDQVDAMNYSSVNWTIAAKVNTWNI